MEKQRTSVVAQENSICNVFTVAFHIAGSQFLLNIWNTLISVSATIS